MHMHKSLIKKRQSIISNSCILYTNPTLNSIQPVLTNINLSWNTSCLPAFTATTADLYLSVLKPTGLIAVKLWPAVNFQSGLLSTQFNPAWWNASTGAGSIEAQLAFTGAGSPIWDTSAPSSPIFAIQYNGTYPSVTAAAFQPASTGPAVQSSDSAASTPSISSGALGAAIAIPIVVLGCLVAAYIVWNRRRKQPEKKRWSAAIDQRMSMMSEGTWQPPRPSTSSARPGSTFDRASHGGPRASIMATGSMGAMRTSQFYADGRPVSSYSASTGRARLPPSPNPNGEMRQIGSGDRVSRVSFMGGERPPLIGVGGKSRSSIYTNRNSSHANNRPPTVRTSTIGSVTSDGSTTTSPKKNVPRSGTTEELSNEAFTNFVNLSSPPVAVLKSPSSSTRSLPPRSSSRLDSPHSDLANLPAIAMMNEKRPHGAPVPLRYDTTSASTLSPTSSNTSSPSLSTKSNSTFNSNSNDSRSPFADPFPLPSPPYPPSFESSPSTMIAMSTHMPMATRDSMMSPDDALLSYAAKRDAATTPCVPGQSSHSGLSNSNLKSKPSLSFLKVPKLVRSASSFLKRNKGIDDQGTSVDGDGYEGGTSVNGDGYERGMAASYSKESLSAYLVPPTSIQQQSRNHYTDNDSYSNPSGTPHLSSRQHRHVEYENPRSSPSPPAASQRVKAPTYHEGPSSPSSPPTHLLSPTTSDAAVVSNRGGEKGLKTMTTDTVDSVYSDENHSTS